MENLENIYDAIDFFYENYEIMNEEFEDIQDINYTLAKARTIIEDLKSIKEERGL